MLFLDMYRTAPVASLSLGVSVANWTLDGGQKSQWDVVEASPVFTEKRVSTCLLSYNHEQDWRELQLLGARECLMGPGGGSELHDSSPQDTFAMWKIRVLFSPDGLQIRFPGECFMEEEKKSLKHWP